MFATPKRHILWRNRMFWRISRQNPSTALGCSELQEPQKTNTFWCAVTHARKRNAWADCDELLHRCRGPRHNHVCRFVLRSLTGFGRGGGQILGFSIDLLRRPYNTLALPCELPCECVMCKAHSKVTQQNYFHHLKRPGYNTEFLLYPRPFR